MSGAPKSQGGVLREINDRSRSGVGVSVCPCPPLTPGYGPVAESIVRCIAAVRLSHGFRPNPCRVAGSDGKSP